MNEIELRCSEDALSWCISDQQAASVQPLAFLEAPCGSGAGIMRPGKLPEAFEAHVGLLVLLAGLEASF